MRKLAAILAMFLCSIGANAQYYNEPFYKEGFDLKTALNTWTIENKSVQETTTEFWSVGNPEFMDDPFSSVDATSKSSLLFKINGGDPWASPKVPADQGTFMLTSSTISAVGKKNLVVGFSATNLYSIATATGLSMYLEVSKDNGSSWEKMFEASEDRFNGTTLNGSWSNWTFFLSSEYDNQSIKLRWNIDATNFTSAFGGEVSTYLDGLFVAERYAADAKITYLNRSYEGNPLRPIEGAFAREEVKVKFSNEGSGLINTIDLCYQVEQRKGDLQAQSIVKETYNLATPLKMGEEGEYTFNQKADFSHRATYDIKAWVDMQGDVNHVNDTLPGVVTNVAASLPYEPTFSTYNNIIQDYGIDEDGWTTNPRFSMGVYTWRLNASRGESIAHWDVDLKDATEDCNASLISCPFAFKKDGNYDLYFSMLTCLSVDADSLKNNVALYYTTDNTGETGLTELWKNEKIDRTNALNQNVRISIKEDGTYYLVFKCTSPKTAALLSLSAIRVYEAIPFDLQPAEVLSPASSVLKYSNAETVKVKIENHGTAAIAESFTVSMSVDGGTAITETVSSQIALGGSLDYTFNQKVDLSDISKEHELKIWTSAAKDTYTKNDTLVRTMMNQVITVPYDADFTTDANGKFAADASNWEYMDNNKDGITFAPVKSQYSNTYVIEYPGSNTTTDEYLYSRPVALNQGSKYRVYARMNVQSQENAQYSVVVELYELKDGKKTLVEQLKNVQAQGFMEISAFPAIKADGVYQIAYHITADGAANFYIRMAEFSVSETADNDIALSEILLPGTELSGFNKGPVGMKVRNNGINSISKFKVQATSVSLGKIEQEVTLNEALEPEASTTVYFDKDFTFTNETVEDIAFTVVMDEDGVSTNNTKTVAVKRLNTLEELPYSIPFAAGNGWLSLNRNKDNKYFTAGTKGYSISLTDIEDDNDWLVSRSMKMGPELPFDSGIYSIAFSYMAKDDAKVAPKFKVYAYNCDTDEKTEIVTMSNDPTIIPDDTPGAESDYFNYIGYMKLEQAANYSIVFEVQKDDNGYNNCGFYDNLTIDEAAVAPDLELKEFVNLKASDVFTATDTIVASFTNKNSTFAPLSCVPFTLEVNDKTYYACYQGSTKSEIINVSFVNVDMNKPGDYKLTAKALVNADANQENNVLMKDIKSLPIIEMEMVSLDSPRSGNLGEEAIVVTLNNNGKGDMKDIPVHYSVTHKESGTVVIADEVIADTIYEKGALQYTFTKKVDMSVEGSYAVKIYVAMDNETNLMNDTVSVNLVCTHEAMDAGVMKIVAPVSGRMSAEEAVTISVKNYSAVVLYDVPVTLVITKGDTEIANLKGYVAEIQAGESVAYTFDSKVDMHVAGEYVILASTALENDGNTDNDACQVTVKAALIDCGVSAITSPTVNTEEGKISITVVVKNFGETKLTGIPVMFKVNTGMPQSETIKDTIEAGETLNYTFKTQYTFKVGKEYKVVAYTGYGEDMNADNDTCEITVNPVVSSIDANRMTTVSMYPNPAKETVTVISDNYLSAITLFDAAGRAVEAFNNIQANEYTFTVCGYAQGIYYVSVQTDKGVETHKLTVTK